jgi:hypothetical protein
MIMPASGTATVAVAASCLLVVSGPCRLLINEAKMMSESKEQHSILLSSFFLKGLYNS